MSSKPARCITPGCPNMTYHLRCLSCSAQEADRRAREVADGKCVHTHSITGDYDMVKRLLPEYRGGLPQEGFMLDVCKDCLQELPERPYNPTRYTRGH